VPEGKSEGGPNEARLEEAGVDAKAEGDCMVKDLGSWTPSTVGKRERKDRSLMNGALDV